MRDRDEQVIGAVITIVALIVCAIVGVVDCRQQRDCEARGGRVERYNYRTIYVTQSCGKGCTMLVPHQVSDWRCIGGRAERDE